MLSLKTLPYIIRPFSSVKCLLPASFRPPFPPLHVLNHRFLLLPPLHLALSYSYSSSSSLSTFSSTTDMPMISIVEHVVLFKVRDSTDPSKIDAMVANLRSLVSLGIATHLTAGPILYRRSAAADAFGFTHLLFNRFRSKPDLATYSAHPDHLAVVRENVIPICDDILAVDWEADVNVDVPPSPESLVRLTLAKPREGTPVAELVKAIDGIRGSLPASVQVSYGENFSPGRAKGYEVGFISVFPGPDEVDAVEGKEEVEIQKEKMRTLLHSVIVVDYLVPSPACSL